MKQVFYLLLTGLISQGCWRHYPTVQSYDKLLNIPTPPHQNAVKIYFPGEPLPQRPYLKIKMITVTGDESVSDNALLNQFKRKAQYEGLDDVILIDKNIRSELVTETTSPGLAETIIEVLTSDDANTETEQEEETITVIYNTKELTGLGIKYIDNMDYIRNLIKTEYVHTYNQITGKFEQAAFVTFKVTGETKERMDKDLLMQYFEDHSLDHLVYEETSKWKYRQLRETLVRRKMLRYGANYKVCDIRLDETDLILKIDIIVFDDDPPTKESIEYSYDENGQLTGRVLRTKRFPYLREERIFKEEGGWEEFRYYNENGTLLMKRTWTCFDLDDLKEMAHQ